jgi:hypothetical protein
MAVICRKRVVGSKNWRKRVLMVRSGSYLMKTHCDAWKRVLAVENGWKRLRVALYNENACCGSKTSDSNQEWVPLVNAGWKRDWFVKKRVVGLVEVGDEQLRLKNHRYCWIWVVGVEDGWIWVLTIENGRKRVLLTENAWKRVFVVEIARNCSKLRVRAQKCAICAVEMARSTRGLKLRTNTQFRARRRNTEQVDQI